MFKKRTFNFKVTTFWPELVNKQIQRIDNLLREVQFSNSSNFLIIKGVIQRQARYLDRDGRNRKTDDHLQFEMVVGEAVFEPHSLFNALLKQNYFLFQPRRFGETHAMLEQGFTLIILKDEPFIQKHTVDIFARTITAKGKENVIFNFMVNFPEFCIEPKYFQGSVFFGNHILPMIHGEIHGVISYRSSRNLLCEMEFSQKINILSDFPPLDKEEGLLIDGKITDFSWKKSSNQESCLLEVKLEWSWRFTKDKIVTCWTENGPGKASKHKMKTPVLSKKIIQKIPKTFSFPASGLQVTEGKITILEHSEKPTPKGLLAHILLLFEIYTISESGIETHQEYHADHEELISGIFQNQRENANRVLTEIEVKYVKSYILNGLINIDLIFDFLINICRDEMVEITESVGERGEFILADVFVEPKTFSLFGENILTLRCKPVQIMKVKARVNGGNSKSKKGWMSISCQLELAVSYLDEAHHFREDVFTIPCHESFLWDKADTSDRVELKSRVDYDSYTCTGAKLFYKYILSFFAELFQTREIKVATIAATEKTSTPKTNDRPHAYGHTSVDYLPGDHDLTQISIEGEILLYLGKPKEIGEVKIFLTEFKYHRLPESVFFEGKIKSEVEYWDDIGYLRHETGVFSFLRLLRGNFDLAPELEYTHPAIHEYSYFMREDRGLWKKSVSVIVQLQFEQKRRG